MSNIFKTGAPAGRPHGAGRAHRRRPRRAAGHDHRLRPGPGHELRQLLVLGQDRAGHVPGAAGRRGAGPRPLRASCGRLATRAGIPMPRVYIIPSDAPNAFATGRNPEHAAVAVTEGIMRILDDEELEGVLAHELAHVKNRDILISTIAATLAGAITYLAHMAQWAAIFGGGRRDERRRGAAASAIGDCSCSRSWRPSPPCWSRWRSRASREFQADATGAQHGRPAVGAGQGAREAGDGVQGGADARHPGHRAPVHREPAERRGAARRSSRRIRRSRSASRGCAPWPHPGPGRATVGSNAVLVADRGDGTPSPLFLGHDRGRGSSARPTGRHCVLDGVSLRAAAPARPGPARPERRRQDHAAADPGHAAPAHRAAALTVGGADCAARARSGARALIGMVAHGSYVYEDLTALENLRFWATLRGGDADGRAARRARSPTVELDGVAGRARAHVLGGHEAAARRWPACSWARPRAAAARRALHRPRPARAQVAGGVPAGPSRPRGGAVVMATHSFGRELGGGRPRRHPGRRPRRCSTRRAPSSPPTTLQRLYDASRRRRRARDATPGARWIVALEGPARRAAVEGDAQRAPLLLRCCCSSSSSSRSAPTASAWPPRCRACSGSGFILAACSASAGASSVERENDCWEGLLLTPGDKSAIYLGKLAGNLRADGRGGDRPGRPLRALLQRRPRGAVLAPLAAGARARHARARRGGHALRGDDRAGARARAALPGAAAARAGAGAARHREARPRRRCCGEPLADVAHWLQLLVGADVVYLVVGLLTFEFVLEG